MEALERVIADNFHAMYYYSPHTWNGGVTRWKGIPVLGNPLDMWMLQQTIVETKPDVIVETGSACGGSALFYTDVLPKVRIISIDIQTEMQPMIEHPRITFVKAMSTDKKTIAMVGKESRGKRVMVILDSDHTTANVLAELKAYAPMVTRGCYLIVQDTNIDCSPVNHPQFKDNGPTKAVNIFMQGNKDFEVDHYKEEGFYMTFYPGGWLRCIR